MAKKITEQQKKWIIKHFKNTKNDEIIIKIGISNSTLHRFARANGLHKTKQFKTKCQLLAAEMAKQSHLRNKTYPQKGFRIPKSEENYFKSGVTPEKRLGKKKNQERIRKSAESRSKTVKAEKRRVLFGLEQKTKLKVFAASHAKAAYRYTLKKRGYLVDRDGKTIFWDANTKRSEKCERTAQERYRFILKCKN